MSLWITVKVNSLRSHYSHFSCTCWDLLCRKALTLTLCMVRMRQWWGHLRCFPRISAFFLSRCLWGSGSCTALLSSGGWKEKVARESDGWKEPRLPGASQFPEARKLPRVREDEAHNRLLGCSHSHRRSPVRSPFCGEQWEVNARTHCPSLVTTLAATFPGSREAFADRSFHPEAHHHLHEWKWVQTDCRDVC